MRSHLRAVLVLGLAAALLALFLRNADLHAVWAEILEGQVSLLVLALGTTMLTYALRAHRWQFILKAVGPTHFPEAFRATVIGFAASFLLPARPGEFLRPYLLARREGLSVAATFATIILERLLDMVAVLCLFAAFLLLFDPGVTGADPAVFRAIKLGGVAAAAGGVVALAVVFLLAGHPEAIGRFSLRIERVLPGRLAHAVAHVAQLFAEGLGVMRRPGQLAVCLALSFPLWLSIAAGIWLVSRAFHIEVPYTGSFLLMTILVVGVAVPTPGAVGGFHEAFRIGLTVFYHVPNDRAIGAAIVLHAISFVPVTILGIAFMAQEGLSLGRMRRLAGQAGAEESVT